MKKPKKIIVIGAGIGGMCVAARLAKLGYEVEIFEKNPMVGGRAYRIEENGYKFDLGPTLLMMIDVLYETFDYCGKNLDDYVELIQLEPNYQVIFGDHSKITVSSNLSKLTKQLSQFDPEAPRQFYKLFGDLAEFYRIARPNFIEKNFNKVTDFISPIHIIKLLRRHGLGKLWDFTGRYFNDHRLRQLFSFQSMYLGISPYDAAAIFAIVSYIETGLGIWYPKGGMYSLSLALEKLCRDLNVKINLNSPVERIVISNAKADGVRIKDKIYKADIIIANADLIYSYKNLIKESDRLSMPDKKLKNYKQASSALLFCWGVEDTLENLLHHNVVLSRDFKVNFDQIFHQFKLPTRPSFYIYVPTKTDSSLAPRNHNVMYLLIPVPNLNAKVDWQMAIQDLQNKVLTRINQEFKIDLRNKIKTKKYFTPSDFQSKFNLYEGSAFGLSHSFFQSGYFRPHNKSKDITNLYFVGASTYPGGGIPMVTLSAKLTVERILLDEQKTIR